MMRRRKFITLLGGAVAAWPNGCEGRNGRLNAGDRASLVQSVQMAPRYSWRDFAKGLRGDWVSSMGRT